MRYANLNITLNNENGLKVSVKQVTKNVAEKVFNDGATVWMHPCNMTLKNVWQEPTPVNNKCGESFANVLNSFSYYNCDSERGKYVIFFIQK